MIPVGPFTSVRRVIARTVHTILPLLNACGEFGVGVFGHITVCPPGIALIKSLLLIALVAGCQRGLEKVSEWGKKYS